MSPFVRTAGGLRFVVLHPSLFQNHQHAGDKCRLEFVEKDFFISIKACSLFPITCPLYCKGTMKLHISIHRKDRKCHWKSKKKTASGGNFFTVCVVVCKDIFLSLNVSNIPVSLLLLPTLALCSSCPHLQTDLDPWEAEDTWENGVIYDWSLSCSYCRWLWLGSIRCQVDYMYVISKYY